MCACVAREAAAEGEGTYGCDRSLCVLRLSALRSEADIVPTPMPTALAARPSKAWMGPNNSCLAGNY